MNPISYVQGKKRKGRRQQNMKEWDKALLCELPKPALTFKARQLSRSR